MAASRMTIDLDRGAFGRNFARLFNDLKRREGTTARAFAQDINVGEERVSKWRSGSLPVPELATLMKIAIRFGVSVDVLLVGVCPQYVTGESVLNGTASKSTPVAKSASSVRGSTDEYSTSATHLLQQIEAREHILTITRKDIHDLTRRLYEAREEVPPSGRAKSVARTVRRKHRG